MILRQKYIKKNGFVQYKFYNGGVVLFDVCKIRKEKFIEKIIDRLKNVCAFYPFTEQDILNIVFAEYSETCTNRISQILEKIF